MLVLSRRSRQSLVIGTDIVITVIAVDGDFVKLGIEAPRSLPVLRQELVQAVSHENQRAGAGVSAPSRLASPSTDREHATVSQPVTAISEAVRHLIPALQGIQSQRATLSAAQAAPVATAQSNHTAPAEEAALTS